MTKRNSVDYEKKKKQPMKRKEELKMKVRSEKEGGAVKKGVLLAIKLPHTEVPPWKPRS